MMFRGKLSKIRDRLKLENPEERFAAVKDLEEMRGKKVAELLEETLNDPSPVVRRRAVNALLERGSREAIPPLIRALNDKDKKVRWMAAYALGRLGEEGYEEAFDAIVKALDDEDWNVRRIVALQLRHSNPEVLDPLLKAIKDQNPFVRQYAAFGLGRTHNTGAVKVLVRALRDDVREVRDYAGWALDLIAKKNNILSKGKLIKLYG